MLINDTFQKLNLKVTSASEQVEVKLNNNVLVILWENSSLMPFLVVFQLVCSHNGHFCIQFLINIPYVNNKNYLHISYIINISYINNL